MALALAACSRDAASRPHCLVVVMSGVRADHTGPGGGPRATTPALDALAATGAWFGSAITVSASPISAHASIQTGLHPSEHNVTPDHPVMVAQLETLAEKLKSAGYTTAAFNTDAAMGRGNGFAQGFDTFEEILPDENGLPEGGAAAAEERFKSWLEARGGAAASSPFFAYVTLITPRLPFSPPAEYQNKFMDTVVAIQRQEKLAQLWIPFARQFTLGLAGLTEDERAVLTSLYDAEIAYTDYRLGRLIDLLRQHQLLDSTLVVVTSDTGEDLGQHGAYADTMNLHDSIVRVPLAVSLPGRIKAAERIAAQVQPTDLMKLILTVTAAPASAPPAEVSAATLMGSRPAAFAEARIDPAAMRTYQEAAPPGTDLSFLQRNLLMARTQDYKYVVTSQQNAALFDLKADPGETASVLASRPQVLSDLAGQLESWAGGLRPVAAAFPAAPDGAPPAQPQGKAAPGARTP